VKAARDLNPIAGGDLEVGGLTVGVFNTTMPGMLPDVLSALKRNRPRIDVYIVPRRPSDASLHPIQLPQRSPAEDGRLQASSM
jgi:hypothetical protein